MIRRDAVIKGWDREDPRRQQVYDWHRELGQLAAREKLRTELGVSSPDDPEKIISIGTYYGALNFWMAQDDSDRMLNVARAQAQVEAAARKGGMTPDELHALTDRNFIAMASALPDKSLYIELRKLRISDEAAKAKTEMDKAKLKQKDEEIALLKSREQRMTCEQFVQWFADQRAQEIMTGRATNAEKIDMLGRQMFGEDWKG